MQIFLPIIIAVQTMFGGYTFTHSPGDLCMLENHKTGEVQIYAADLDAWCSYTVEAGTEYTITVSHDRQIWREHTFVAVAWDEEY